jgi:hypothetical protein
MGMLVHNGKAQSHFPFTVHFIESSIVFWEGDAMDLVGDGFYGPRSATFGKVNTPNVPYTHLVYCLEICCALHRGRSKPKRSASQSCEIRCCEGPQEKETHCGPRLDAESCRVGLVMRRRVKTL